MTRKLCVSNLSLSVTSDDLERKFEQFGRVLSVSVSADLTGGGRRSSGLVEMESESEAHAAISRLNMTQHEGDLISVYMAAKQSGE